MAKHVLRAMLPGNHEVFKKSLVEATPHCPDSDVWHIIRIFFDLGTAWQRMAGRSLTFTGRILLMPWRDQLLSCSIKTNCTLLSSLGNPLLCPLFWPLNRLWCSQFWNGVSGFRVISGSSPLLALFYADALFSGANMSHHPIYSKLFLVVFIHVMHTMDVIQVIALMAI